MINGKYLARRVGEHLNTHYGFRSRQVEWLSDERVILGGIEFMFEIGAKQGENRHPFAVRVTPLERENNFSEHIDLIQTAEFWANPELAKLKESRNEYEKFLHEEIRHTVKEDGSYVFQGVLMTNNESKAFFTLFNHIVKPVWLYRRNHPL